MRWRLFLLVIPVVLLALLVVPFVTLPLKQPEIPVATEVLDVNGRLITRLYEAGGGNRIQVPVTEMPAYLKEAIVSMEDRQFYQHHGINPVGILRALIKDIQQRRVVEGGSTITQQVAKNLYTGGERTLRRKLYELVLTFKLESRYSKDEILGMYLNTIYLGHGAWGVEVASQTYFGKSVRDLDLAESALLAGLPRSPEYYSPYNHPNEARARRDFVLQTMADLGYISQAQASRAKAEPLKLAGLKPAGRQAPYFVDYVLSQLNPTVAEDVTRGGYRIYTTLDLDMQKVADTAVANGVGKTSPDAKGVPQPEAALIAVDPNTGYIKAMVGGDDYGKTQFNRALARRQPGSAFKPFLYSTVLARGDLTAASTQVCEPVSFPGPTPDQPYEPTDFDPKKPYHYRPMGVREAIRVSDNVVAVRWGQTVGPDSVARTARAMGITSPLQPDLTLSLGSSAVTPLEMAAAFSALAHGGVRADPLAVIRIEDRFGNLVQENRSRFSNVLDPRVAYILTDIMKEVLWPGGTAGGTGGLIGGRPAAGKTGTTDRLVDAWFVGYTPDLVAAVWVGNDDPANPINKTGGTAAAPIWGRFVADSLKNVPLHDFPRPEGITEAVICDESGLLANPTCPSSHTELFLAGTEPTQMDPTDYSRTPGQPAPGAPPAGGVPPVTPAPQPGFRWPFPAPNWPWRQPAVPGAKPSNPVPKPGTKKKEPATPAPAAPVTQPQTPPAPAPEDSEADPAPGTAEGGGPVPVQPPVPTPDPAITP